MIEKEKQTEKITITPETALGYVGDAVSKYRGPDGSGATIADFRVLTTSMSILRNVVKEWKALKAEKEAAGNRKSRRVRASKAKANGKSTKTSAKKASRKAASGRKKR